MGNPFKMMKKRTKVFPVVGKRPSGVCFGVATANCVAMIRQLNILVECEQKYAFVAMRDGRNGDCFHGSG